MCVCVASSTGWEASDLRQLPKSETVELKPRNLLKALYDRVWWCSPGPQLFYIACCLHHFPVATAGTEHRGEAVLEF